jgi:hypothetical protein
MKGIVRTSLEKIKIKKQGKERDVLLEGIPPSSQTHSSSTNPAYFLLALLPSPFCKTNQGESNQTPKKKM